MPFLQLSEGRKSLVSAVKTGGLCALDLATTTGYAFGMPGDPPSEIESGYLKLPGKLGSGAVFVAYETWLRAALARWQPRLVVYEAPFLDQHRTSIDVATRLIGLGVLTVKCCHEAKVYRVEQANNSAVKKAIVGSGKGAKADMIFAVRQYGFNVSEDNEADAIGIWLYAERLHAPHVKRTAGALFAA